ncbi:MAG TPA: glycoside hydrolase family 3 N-terminal domain-containing protein [archaeon]|nr:glycoside hydrolase family 3 N-terminal domain-containing protein [archaeon]
MYFKKHLIIKLAAIVFPLLFSSMVCGQSGPGRPAYLDPAQPLEKRVEDLLGRMTLAEKIGQMNMPTVSGPGFGKSIPEKMDGARRFAEGTKDEGIGPAGGFFALPANILHKGPRQQAEFLNELQKIATGKTRLKIPLLETEEGTHGFLSPGATIFPEGLAIGSTWDMDLVREIYSVAAKEARAVGIHQLCTLVVEPNRDPRLGRNEEGYSEDPFLCAAIAESIVKGMQGEDLAAPDKAVSVLCHYPGQGQPVSGLERGAMEISERMLREVFLPPFAAGIRRSGALGVMATYPAMDGVPVHASKKILTDILREELGFKGLVLSEGAGISSLIYEGLAPTQKEAGELALKAGVDVGIWYEPAYMQSLIENVAEGRVSPELIDRAVRRILTQKFRLGLFENPFADLGRAVKIINSSEHRSLALRVAREGIVLLKNENNLLPLKKNLKKIAVVGPLADHPQNQLGDYTSGVLLQDIVTVLEGIKEKVSPSTEVVYVKGCEVIGEDLNELAEAREAADRADVAVVVLGEGEDNKGERKYTTDGEAFDIASLDLTGLQQDLIRAVYETGTPTVLVLLNGRPLSIRWCAEHVPAILEPWKCGEEGGRAVAEVLFGDVNPSGRLPVTVPRHVGQLPVYYNYKKSKKYWIENAWGKAYVDLSPEPLYEFGYGLSYTKFEYSDLEIVPQATGPSGNIRIRLDVRNVGEREGKEVVQLYLNDPISTVSTPVKELKGFRKIALGPGEKKTVEFTLTPDHLSLLDRHLERLVEPGTFEVMIGSSSKDIRLRGSFEIRD